MFRKFLSILLLAGGLLSCGGGRQSSLASWMAESGHVKVLCTTAQIGDLAAEIGGDRIDTLVLIRGSLDPHSYELVKGDDEKLKRAGAVFYNGLGLEHGAGLASWLSSHETCVSMGGEILRRQPGRLLHKGSAADPHVWMDISLWREATHAIEERLAALDPEGAAEYHGRAEILRSRMDLAHRELIELFREVPQAKRYFVTSHDAFQYFTRAYLAEGGDWESRFAAPEGLAPDGQLGAADIQRIVSYLAKHRVRVIFPESNVSKDSIRKIAQASREMGFDVEICPDTLYGDAMDREGLHYLEMMRHNADTLVKHLDANQGNL